MIHCELNDGRTVLIGDNEAVSATAHAQDAYFETHECRRSKLPEIKPAERRFIRINHRGPWFPVNRLRRIGEDL
jgi:hypothetical protein